MAKADKAPASEDIWHLSIDDLLASPDEARQLAGPGPFVINLSTSTASIGAAPHGLRGFDGLHLYQVRREAAGGPQFLLRLGIIATEVEADAILSEVLEYYPGATKDCAEGDDRHAVNAKILPSEPLTPVPPPAEEPAEATRPPPRTARSAAEVTGKSPEPFSWDIDELLPELGAARPAKSFTAPKPAALANPPAQTSSDYDPLATTQEVEAPTGVFERLQSGVATALTPGEAGSGPTTPVESQALEPAGFEVAAVEAHDAAAFTFELSTTETTAAMPIESPDTQSGGLESQAAEAHASQAVRSPASIATSVQQQDADSGTLEQLVAKIDALVDSADAHDKHAVSQQPFAGDVAAPTPPSDPVKAIGAVVLGRPADRPAPRYQVPQAEPAPTEAPTIDSTRTVRALTPLELADDQASQWFSIQLVLSEESIDPEHVPSLDIFNEYRLYSVTGLDNEHIMHALRLGFFSSELAADSVAGYLRGYFDAPCIKRVSAAERERFAEETVTARKDVGATGLHAVIELTSPTPLPERQADVSASGKRRVPQSVWSRIVAPLKR